MHKGQAEAVGLLIIVILLLFLGFVFLQFQMRDNGQDYASVRQNIAAHGLLRALLQLETGEGRFQDLTAGCYYNQAQCLLLQQQVRDVFSVVLNSGQHYKLVITGEEKTLLEEGSCTQGIVNSIPFTLENVLYEGTLTLC